MNTIKGIDVKVPYMVRYSEAILLPRCFSPLPFMLRIHTFTHTGLLLYRLVKCKPRHGGVFKPYLNQISLAYIKLALHREKYSMTWDN